MTVAPISRAAEFASFLQKMQAEAGGVLAVEAFQPRHLDEMVEAATSDPYVAAMLDAVTSTVLRIERSSPGEALCSCCGTPLRGGKYHLALAVPQCDAPVHVLAMPIAFGCATTVEEVIEAGQRGLRDLFPDVRRVHPVDQVGHA